MNAPVSIVTRREFLKLAGASVATAIAGCRAPQGEIVPAAADLGAEPRYFATAMPLGGSACGLLVESNLGRPTKVEGNPLHPSSLGATDLFAQASILRLWKGARLSLVRKGEVAATRAMLEAALADIAARGNVRVLTRYDTSPTFAALMHEAQARVKGLAGHVWEPLHRDHSLEGARLAFGRPVQCVHRPAKADVIVTLDADLAGSGPGHLRYAREVASRRHPGEMPMSRIYAIESTPTLIGAIADHRAALAPWRIGQWLAALAQALESPGDEAARVDGVTVSPAAVARDLAAHRGRALIVAGESLPPEAHALVHALNARLGAPGNTVEYIEPVWGAVSCTQSIAERAADIRAGGVNGLIVLGGNPAYDAPADLEFAELIARVPFSLHLTLGENETSHRCGWRVPEAHFLEQWSDARAHDGTASIVQPLIAPLTGGFGAHEIVATLAGRSASPLDLVRAQWRGTVGRDDAWRACLRDGVIPGTAAPTLDVRARPVRYSPAPAAQGWSLALREDMAARDGEFVDNAWLQEIPRTHSKITWDNAIYASPAGAKKLGMAEGDLLELRSGGKAVRGPLWILPGQADDTLTVGLGYGRRIAGPAGKDVGFDAYPLRTAQSPWTVAGVEARRVEGRHEFASTQHHSRMETGEPVKRMRLADLVAGAKLADETPRESMYPEWPYVDYRWAMSIDLASCIGCNACTVACQAENNIPVVGKEQVRAGREMHWIRVDRYYEGAEEAPRTLFQPVPCMHCEHAPCELVCPVGATMHDASGLNVQVYNRCVGTRFCSQNCPYKVRRFNFFAFGENEFEPPLEARNPEVTVRMRGVMEKCNYCQQRIVRARIAADREQRRLEEGEVVTACQAVCPTRAIAFGDLNDPKSAVSLARKLPRQYALLAELNTRPRTTYLARVENPNPDPEGPSA